MFRLSDSKMNLGFPSGQRLVSSFVVSMLFVSSNVKVAGILASLIPIWHFAFGILHFAFSTYILYLAFHILQFPFSVLYIAIRMILPAFHKNNQLPVIWQYFTNIAAIQNVGVLQQIWLYEITGACYWCVKIPQCGYMTSKWIMTRIMKQFTDTRSVMNWSVITLIFTDAV